MAFAPAGLPSGVLSPRLSTLWWIVLAVGGTRESNTTTLELPNLAPRPEVAELVRRCQDGENEAFGLLYDRYADLVFRYVVYRVGNTSVAEDIVSETFLRALRRIGSFSWQGTDIGAWFVTIARNLIVDYSRSSPVRLEFPSDDVLAAADEPSGASASPEDAVLTGLRNRLLLDAVRTLSPDQRECVVLRFLEGLSIQETANVMDRGVGAVKQLQLRAVRALARSIQRQDQEFR
jgi:RNA polymerase sigma-70 factor (ECF subfamily)